MTRVIGVRFRTAGKIYYFDPGNFDIKKGDHVIVETARGVEYGTVLADPRDVEDSEVTKPLKAVLRMANEKDDEQEKSNRVREKEAFKICKEKIIKHGLEMKLIDAEYTFDNNKVLFYFTADGRIDFRDLVKDLASEFKTRIELRQIGVRDETKIIGGYGICGRPLCCHSYLSDFIPVSIKMAKEQNLSLNPTKISGVCGRLMCCLKNEEDVYEELNRKMPGIGDIVRTNDDLEGEVASVNILRQTVRILVDVDDEKEVHEVSVDDFTVVRKKQKHKQNAPKEKDADEEAAKALEQQDKDLNAPEKPAKNKNQNNQNRQGNQNNQGRQNNNQNSEAKKEEARSDKGQSTQDSGAVAATDETVKENNNRQNMQNGSHAGGQSNKDTANQNNKEFKGQNNKEAGGQKNKEIVNQNNKEAGGQNNKENSSQKPKDSSEQNNNEAAGQNNNQGKGQKKSDKRGNKRRNFNKNKNRNRDNKNQDNRNQDNRSQENKGQDKRNQDNRKQNHEEGINGQG